MQILINFNFTSGKKMPVVVEQGDGFDKTVHLKAHEGFFTPSGNLENHHKINCKGKVENIQGYLLSYLGRTIGDNPKESNHDLASFTLDGTEYTIQKHVSIYEDVVEQLYLNGTPVEPTDRIDITLRLSGSNVHMNRTVEELINSQDGIFRNFVVERIMIPKAMHHGIPRYCRSDLINSILYYSGVDAVDREKFQRLKEMINVNRVLLKAVALEMESQNLTVISLKRLNMIINRCPSVKSISASTQGIIENYISSEVSEATALDSYTFHGKNKLITLRSNWF